MLTPAPGPAHVSSFEPTHRVNCKSNSIPEQLHQLIQIIQDAIRENQGMNTARQRSLRKEEQGHKRNPRNWGAMGRMATAGKGLAVSKYLGTCPQLNLKKSPPG